MNVLTIDVYYKNNKSLEYGSTCFIYCATPLGFLFACLTQIPDNSQINLHYAYMPQVKHSKLLYSPISFAF